MTGKDHGKDNETNIRQAVLAFAETVLKQIKDSKFFTANLSVTVQDGVIRTAKSGTETCTHFTAKA